MKELTKKKPTKHHTTEAQSPGSQSPECSCLAETVAA